MREIKNNYVEEGYWLALAWCGHCQSKLAIDEDDLKLYGGEVLVFICSCCFSSNGVNFSRKETKDRILRYFRSECPSTRIRDHKKADCSCGKLKELNLEDK